MKFQRRKECNRFHFPIFYVELPKLRWVFHRSLGRVVGMHRFPGSQGACSHGRWNSVRCCIIQLERSGQPKCTKARRYAKCKSQKRSLLSATTPLAFSAQRSSQFFKIAQRRIPENNIENKGTFLRFAHERISSPSGSP